MQEDYNKLAQRLDQIEDDVKEIKAALLGNKYTKEKGFVHTLENHENRLEKIEKVVNNGKWLLIGLSASSGVGLLKIIETIFK